VDLLLIYFLQGEEFYSGKKKKKQLQHYRAACLPLPPDDINNVKRTIKIKLQNNDNLARE